MISAICPRCAQRPSRAEGKALCADCAVCAACATTEAAEYRPHGDQLLCLPCKEAALLTASITAAGIPPRYRAVTVDQLSVGQRTIAAEWTVGPRCGNVYLCGAAGVGKTHTAAAMLGAALARGLTGRWVNLPWLFASLRDRLAAEGPRGGQFSMKKAVRELVEVDCLVLDDLGAHRATEWAIEVLYLVLDQREAENVSGLLITSNLHLADVTKVFGDRIADRMKAGARILELTGDSRRTRRAPATTAQGDKQP